jgi:cytochrome b
MTQHETLQRIRIWDLPTRIFHVLLILSIAGLIITGEVGGDAMPVHFLFGYNVLALVLFRVVWGVFGGHWSRFRHFIPTPSELLTYVRSLRTDQSSAHVGHNPLGALSVLGMLVILLLQVLSGFFSDDEISNSGPWTIFVSGDWVSWATEYHSEIGKTVLLLLIGLHIGTVLFYKRIKQVDLIKPMIHGDKDLPQETLSSRDTFTSRLFALALYVGCAYVVYRLVYLA